MKAGERLRKTSVSVGSIKRNWCCRGVTSVRSVFVYWEQKKNKAKKQTTFVVVVLKVSLQYEALIGHLIYINTLVIAYNTIVQLDLHSWELNIFITYLSIIISLNEQKMNNNNHQCRNIEMRSVILILLYSTRCQTNLLYCGKHIYCIKKWGITHFSYIFLRKTTLMK